VSTGQHGMPSEPTNRYAAPRAEVGDPALAGAAATAATAARLPVVLLLRWLVSALLLGFGAWRVWALVANWRFYADSAIIQPAYNPWPRLALELCMVAAGALLALRSRWVFVPLALHVVLFTWHFAGLRLHVEAVPIWALELQVFCFCAWLWLRRALR